MNDTNSVINSKNEENKLKGSRENILAEPEEGSAEKDFKAKNEARKPLDYVITAIDHLKDERGLTSKEINSYLSQEFDSLSDDMNKAIQTALHRGVQHGILKCDNGHYSLDPRNEPIPLTKKRGKTNILINERFTVRGKKQRQRRARSNKRNRKHSSRGRCKSSSSKPRRHYSQRRHHSRRRHRSRSTRRHNSQRQSRQRMYSSKRRSNCKNERRKNR